ncbi:MAG: ComEA family DNA-binding protein [Rhodococcus sp.]|nr:ComEA family DNA-binding protein [Rhodococcus sp. (in: high G+C Gram-positive bacteria)]
MIAVGLLIVVAVGFAVWRDDSLPAVPPVPVAQAGVLTTGASDSTVSGATGDTTGAAETVDPAAITPPSEIVVSVVGLVHAPGIVHLTDGDRVADALAAAGGVIAGADTLSLNLAQRLADGDQVVVGSPDPHRPPSSSTTSSENSSFGSSPGGSTQSAAGPINLNTATAAELETLPGVGPVTASAIISWRERNGKFTSIDQLMNVDGIGPARVEKIRPLVRV